MNLVQNSTRSRSLRVLVHRKAETMQLQVHIPDDDLEQVQRPDHCPYPGCGGTEFKFIQRVTKQLLILSVIQVAAERYRCLCCSRTFRVYPAGVTAAFSSQSLQKLVIILYMLGLSYGSVSQLLQAYGTYISKSKVFEAVRNLRWSTPALTRTILFTRTRVSRLHNPPEGYVYFWQQWRPCRLEAHHTSGSGIFFTISDLNADEAAELQARLAEIAANLCISLCTSRQEEQTTL